MNNTSDKKPLIKEGWLRVLLFMIAFLLIAFLVAIIVLLLVAPINLSELPSDMGSHISDFISHSLWVMVLIEFLTSVIAVFIFRKYIDRKTMVSLGLSTKGRIPEMVSGFFLAPALIGLGALFLFVTKHLEWDNNDFDAKAFLIDMGSLILIAFGEELVFRGYVLNNLMQSFHKWVALIISAVLFMLYHMTNPGIGTLPLVNLFLAGLLFGINYVYTKNLWFSILMHFSWNFFQGLLYGFKVSGVEFSSLLQTTLKGDASITGNGFGFEGSVVASLLLFISLAVFYLVYERKFALEKTNGS